MASNPNSTLGLVYQGFGVASGTDGTEAEIRLIRDGSLSAIPWMNAIGLQGRAFIVGYGTNLTTIPTKTLAAAQPDTNLDIPAGTVVMPLGASLELFSAATTTAMFFALRLSAALIGAGTSSAATQAPLNLRYGASTTPNALPMASACTGRQAYSGNGAAEVTPVELWGASQNAVDTASQQVTTFWYQPPTAILVYGPASINGYAMHVTAAGAFKFRLYFAEFSSTLFG